MSALRPGPDATIILIGRAGHSWPRASRGPSACPARSVATHTTIARQIHSMSCSSVQRALRARIDRRRRGIARFDHLGGCEADILAEAVGDELHADRDAV